MVLMTKSSGRVFQTGGPATEKTLLPTVESLTGGTSRLLELSWQAQCSSTGLIGNRSVVAEEGKVTVR